MAENEDKNTRNDDALLEIGKKKGYKTMKSYVDYVMKNLGNQIIKIELSDEQVAEVVEMALGELAHYINDTKSITVPYKSVIDTSKWPLKVSVVNYVMRGQSAVNYIPVDAISTYYVNGINNGMAGLSLDQIANALSAQQNINALSTDLDFRFEKDEQKLYVTCNAMKPSTLTIDYMPEYTCVDDIKEPYWQNYLKRFSLAMTKVILGRIRSKYTLNSSQYTIDGPTMLSEGNQELADIRATLKDNVDSLFVID